MAHPSLRRRDGAGNLDDDFYGDERRRYPGSPRDFPPRRGDDDFSPPRRAQTERAPRRDYDDFDRHRSRREPPLSNSRSPVGGNPRAPPSPIDTHREPPRSNRHSYLDPRDSPRDVPRSARDPYTPRDPYSPRDPYDRRDFRAPPRARTESYEPGPRGVRRAPPLDPRDDRARPLFDDRERDREGLRRSNTGASRRAPAYEEPIPRSHDRARPPPAGLNRPGPGARPRRNSLGALPSVNKETWSKLMKNPMIQAGMKSAATGAADAFMRGNHKDQTLAQRLLRAGLSGGQAAVMGGLMGRNQGGGGR